MKLKSLNIFSKEGERKMRTFTRKRGLFAAAATLLIVTVMLVTTWCTNDIGDGGGYTDDFILPPGKGGIRINFNKDIARTIIPDGADVNIFDQFLFSFTPTSGVITPINKTVPKAKLYDVIVLDTGTYDLSVIAYIADLSQVMQPAAVTDAAAGISVTISAGTTINKTIELKVYEPDGTKDGIFSYTLTLVAPLITFSPTDTATMVLTKIGETNATETKNIKTEFDGNPKKFNIASGYYYLDFILKVNGDTVNFRHVVHIYQGMTSSYTFNISMNYFGAGFQLNNGNIIYDPLDDHKPELEYIIVGDVGSATPVLDKGTIPFQRGHDLSLTVTNDLTEGYIADEYEWYCLSNESLGVSSIFVMRATNPSDPFYYSRDYSLMVLGTTADGKKHASTIIITVAP